MDGTRFDDLTRTLAGGLSRRGLVRGALAALGASLATGRAVAAQSACPPGQSWCDGGCLDLTSGSPYCGACGNTCLPDHICHDGSCVPAFIEDDAVIVASGDSNAVFEYGSDCPAGQIWCSGTCVDPTTIDNCGACGNVCPDPPSYAKCQVAVCNGGVCEFQTVPAGTPCETVGCATGACVGSRCEATPLPGYCLFDSQHCYEPGDRNPYGPCLVCDPDRHQTHWQHAEDGSSCGLSQVCCGGSCCAAGQACVDGACVGGGPCKPGGADCGPGDVCCGLFFCIAGRCQKP